MSKDAEDMLWTGNFLSFFLSDQKRMSEKVPLRLSRDGDVVDK